MARTHTPDHRIDQASRLRELARRRTTCAKTVAITSGKGGVGKSNVAVNLSIYLAAKGLRVVLVDMDLGLANADLLLDVQPRYNLSHVLTGLRTLPEISVEGPCGLTFIPGASGIESLANLSEFERRSLIAQIEKLKHSADIVVLDCGAGISKNVLSFASAADHVLVVTTPQPPAVTDAYATIKALHREGSGADIRVVVNMARSRSQADVTYKRLSKVAQRFLNYSVAYAGYMLHDTAVETAVQERCPFVVRYPESNASACIAALAGDMARTFLNKSQRGGLFKRVVGLFV